MRKVRPAKLPALGLLLTLWTVLAVSCAAEPTEGPLPIATAIPTATTVLAPTVLAPTATLTSTPVATPTVTPVPTPTLVPNATPAPTPTPGPLTSKEVFARISPSVAFIETPIGSGSGVLIKGGYVITNAYLVWPYSQARVVFSDGSEHINAPVLNSELMGDLAVIGPLNTPTKPVALVNGEDLIIGSDLFLIGYPAGAELSPRPTITRGTLSRYRQWESLEMTYFQSDASISGGRSGGVLVSGDGRVIGIAGFLVNDASFALVASAADVLPRVERLIALGDVAGLGDWRVPSEGGQHRHNFSFRHGWGSQGYIINEPVGTTVEIGVGSFNDTGFQVLDVYGDEIMSVDETFGGIEEGSAAIQTEGPIFLSVELVRDEPGDILVASNQAFMPLHDRDDNTVLAIGQTLPALIGHPGDVDVFSVWLWEGSVIEVTADTANFDSFVMVTFRGAKVEEIVFDDDSGGGFMGTDAKVTFQAPHTGDYFILVQDSEHRGMGGYFLTVAEAPPGAVLSPTFPPQPPGYVKGVSLGAMLPELVDLAPGAAMESEGFQSSSNYERKFVAQGNTFDLGSSRVTGISASVQLMASALESNAMLVGMAWMTPQQVGEVVRDRMMQTGHFQGTPGIPEEAPFDSLEIPPIGDASTGYLMSTTAADGGLDGHLILIVEGRVFSTVTVVGPAGQVEIEDVLSLAQLILGRIRNNSPPV